MVTDQLFERVYSVLMGQYYVHIFVMYLRIFLSVMFFGQNTDSLKHCCSLCTHTYLYTETLANLISTFL